MNTSIPRAGGGAVLAVVCERDRLGLGVEHLQRPSSAACRIGGPPIVADRILDRLVHSAHRIGMRSDSMRKKRGI